MTHKAVSDRQAFEQEILSFSKVMKVVIQELKLHCEPCHLSIPRLVSKSTLNRTKIAQGKRNVTLQQSHKNIYVRNTQNTI